MSNRLVNVYRGELIESINYGSVAVVDKEGKLLASYGDSQLVTYWRSAAKPFQAMAVLTSGAAEEYDITDKELAVMCASHNGEEEHQELVYGVLSRLGLSADVLQCGIHTPYSEEMAQQLERKAEKPSEIHNTCSGKHSGILAVCRKMGWSIDDYNNISHPVQQYIISIIEDILQYPAEKLSYGVDGCGVVVYGLPLYKMAYAYAVLANPDHLPDKYKQAAIRISNSMKKYPYVLAGKGRFNTDLLENTNQKMIAKSGAEGVFCIGFEDDILSDIQLPFSYQNGIGIAIKIADGNLRAIPPVITEILQQLNLLSDIEKIKIEKYHHPKVLNNHKAYVGRIEADFSLNIYS